METRRLLVNILANEDLHAKWLNTLSYMENCGARKISKSEHPTLTDIEVLKHAAEEFRHAYYLKKMIDRVKLGACPNYELRYLLAPRESRRYLDALDVFASRHLKESFGYAGRRLAYGAYLLVTYAIEVRADQLYPIYHELLKQTSSKVSVYNIIKEEEGHLEHIKDAMAKFFSDPDLHAEAIVTYEKEKFYLWMKQLETELSQVGAMADYRLAGSSTNMP